METTPETTIETTPETTMTIPASIRKLANYYPETQDLYSVYLKPCRYGRYGCYGENIKTVVTKDAATVDEWIDKVYKDYKDEMERNKEDKYNWGREYFIVGLAVEWEPSYEAAKSLDTSPIVLLQLCVRNRCLIFQITRSYQMPKTLHKFLQDDDLRFAGVGIDRIALKLEKEFGFCVGRTADIKDLAVESGTYNQKDWWWELKRNALRLREMEIPAVTNWGQKYLTQEQVLSACVDAYVCLKIGEELDYLLD